MVIICNGAFKSGSTWLYLIVEELLKIKEIPFNQNINNDWVGEKNNSFLFKDQTIQKAIPEYVNKGGFYLSKTHLLSPISYSFLKTMNSEKVKVLFIERNLGDAVVSHFHHVKTQTEKNIDFNQYYKLLGRYKAKEIISFKENKNKYLPDSFSLKFEDLKTDFEEHVYRISKFLNLSITQEDVDKVKKNTSLQKLKLEAKKGKVSHYSKDSEKAAKLFRKGKIGESESVLNTEQKEDLEKITRGKTSVFFNFYYTIFFKWRRKLYKM
jgi:hypothetical protein